MSIKRVLIFVLPIVLLLSACGFFEDDYDEWDAEEYESDEEEGEYETPGESDEAPEAEATQDVPVGEPTYFVGPENCDNDGEGTRESPFCSVQVGLDSLSAGDILMILDGVYPERVYLLESGTEDNPIIITGESWDAIIDGGCPDYPCPQSAIDAGEQFTIVEDDNEPLYAAFFVGWVDHVVLDGFTVRNSPLHAVEVVDSTGVTIQNMRVQNAVMSVVNVYNSYDLRILNNEISGGNLGWMTTDGTMIHETHEEAVSIVNTDGFEIAGNHVSDGIKEGIVVKVGTRNGTIHHNTIERLCDVGIYVDEAHDVEIYANNVSDIGFIRNNLTDTGARGEAVQRCDEVLTGPRNEGPEMDQPDEEITTFEAPEWEPGVGIMLAVGDLSAELNTGRLSNVNIYQNVVRDINVGCIVLWDEIRENRGGTDGTLTNVRIFNNVLYNCARSRAGYGPGVGLDISTVDARIHNNIIALAGESIADNGSTGTLLSHNLFFQAGDPVGEGSVNADPLFANPPGGDFSLQAGSPAIDAGTDVGLPFAGSAPDIGAIESGL
jgi:hypothetical protein